MEIMGRVQNGVTPETGRLNDTTGELDKNKKSAVTSAKRFVFHRFLGRFWLTLVAATVLSRVVLPTWAQESSNIVKTESSDAAKPEQESSDIAKAAQNPIAHMISVPFENDFYPHTGPRKDDQYVLEMKPVGGAPKLYEGSWAQIQGAIEALVKRAIKSGDIRKDIDAFDLLRAPIGVSNVSSTADWQQSAKRLVDILITGSRPSK